MSPTFNVLARSACLPRHIGLEHSMGSACAQTPGPAAPARRRHARGKRPLANAPRGPLAGRARLLRAAPAASRTAAYACRPYLNPALRRPAARACSAPAVSPTAAYACRQCWRADALPVRSAAARPAPSSAARRAAAARRRPSSASTKGRPCARAPARARASAPCSCVHAGFPDGMGRYGAWQVRQPCRRPAVEVATGHVRARRPTVVLVAGAGRGAVSRLAHSLTHVAITSTPPHRIGPQVRQAPEAGQSAQPSRARTQSRQGRPAPARAAQAAWICQAPAEPGPLTGRAAAPGRAPRGN